MPRPTSKQALLAESDAEYSALLALVAGLEPSDRSREFEPGTMNRNIRDVLGHLHHWHLLLLGWYTVGMRGGPPEMPAAGFSWSQTKELNREIHARYTALSLRQVRTRLARSHAAVTALIQRHSDDELFAKRRYRWTGSTSLGAYLISATSSHYVWASRLIRRGLGHT